MGAEATPTGPTDNRDKFLLLGDFITFLGWKLPERKRKEVSGQSDPNRKHCRDRSNWNFGQTWIRGVKRVCKRGDLKHCEAREKGENI